MLLPSAIRQRGQKVQHPVCICGKRPGRSSLVASAAGQLNSLLFLVDGYSAKRFLVDTGAAVSVFPASHQDIDSGSRTLSLVAANGSKIATYGTRKMKLRPENQDYTWPFILAEVKTPLLGADFLQTHGLLVDLQSQRLVNTTSFYSQAIQSAGTVSAPRRIGRHIQADTR